MEMALWGLRLSTLLQGAKRQKVALAEPLVPTTRTSTRVRVPTKFEDAAKLTDSDGEEDAGTPAAACAASRPGSDSTLYGSYALP